MSIVEEFVLWIGTQRARGEELLAGDLGQGPAHYFRQSSSGPATQFFNAIDCWNEWLDDFATGLRHRLESADDHVTDLRRRLDEAHMLVFSVMPSNSRPPQRFDLRGGRANYTVGAGWRDLRAAVEAGSVDPLWNAVRDALQRSVRSICEALIRRAPELRLRDLKPEPSPSVASRIVFVSYDTRDVSIADWVKRVLTARLPSDVRVFVAKYDIAAGDDPLFVMLKENLLRADALVAVCSSLSSTASWLAFESGAVWARDGLVLPLFVDIAPSAFRGPLTLVSQGRSISDRVELKSLISAVAHLYQPNQPVADLTEEESRTLQDALEVSRKQSQLSLSPLMRKLRECSYQTKIIVMPLNGGSDEEAPFHLEKVDEDLVVLCKESNQERVSIPLAYIHTFCKRGQWSDDLLLTLLEPAELAWKGRWTFHLRARP